MREGVWIMSDMTSAWKKFLVNHPALAAERNRRIRKTVVKILLMELVIGGLITASYFAAKDQFMPLLAVGAVAAVVLPWVTVKPQRLLKRKYMGHIASIQYIQRRVSTDGGGPSRMMTSMADVIFIRCTVTDKRGKKHTFELPEKYACIYHEGDLILSKNGFAFPINMTDHDLTLCPCCGGIQPTENGECRNCS